MADRNPSPPLEIDENAKCREDFIGDTAVSKAWLFKVLMNMAQEATSHKDEEDDAVDIEDELESDCCNLWDLSADKDIAVFMSKHDCFKIIAGIISQSKAPRLTVSFDLINDELLIYSLQEVSVGILANVACYNETCIALTDVEELRQLLISLLSCRDSPTLVETVRLLRSVLCNDNTKQLWTNSIKEYEDVYQDVIYILCNSSNSKLLSSLLEVITTLLDESSSLLECYRKVEFIECLIEAGKQILEDKDLSCDKPFTIGSALHVLQIIIVNQCDESNIAGDEVGEKIVKLCKAVSDLWSSDDCEVITTSLEKTSFTQDHVAILSLLSLLNDVESVNKRFKSSKQSSMDKIIKHIHEYYKKKNNDEENNNSLCLIQELSQALISIATLAKS